MRVCDPDPRADGCGGGGAGRKAGEEGREGLGELAGGEVALVGVVKLLGGKFSGVFLRGHGLESDGGERWTGRGKIVLHGEGSGLCF